MARQVGFKAQHWNFYSCVISPGPEVDDRKPWTAVIGTTANGVTSPTLLSTFVFISDKE